MNKENTWEVQMNTSEPDTQPKCPLLYDETNIESAAIEIAEAAKNIRPFRRPFNIGTGVKCRFCGQLQIIPENKLKTFRDFADAEEYASTCCECADAKGYKAAKEQELRKWEERRVTLTAASSAIEEHFGDGSDIPMPQDVRDIIEKIAELVYDQRIKSFSMAISGKIKVIISRTAKDKLVIDRKDHDTNRIEIG